MWGKYACPTLLATMTLHDLAPPTAAPLPPLQPTPHRHQALLATSAKQREARRYEEAVAGRYRPAAPAAAAELEKARGRQERLVGAVRGLSGELGVALQMERVLAHAAELGE